MNNNLTHEEMNESISLIVSCSLAEEMDEQFDEHMKNKAVGS